MSEEASGAAPLAADVARRLRQLDTPNAASLRGVRREVTRQLAGTPGRKVIELAAHLVELGAPGAYPVAYELIRYHPAALSLVRARDLRRLGRYMSGWGDVDSFAAVGGAAWRERQVADAVIHGWARSPDRWWRRAALVSTVPLNVKAHGGWGDARRTLAVCGCLLEDRDDMVVKAMSWALRALAVREPKAVREFVRRHESALAPRVIREVRNKLRTGRKDGR